MPADPGRRVSRTQLTACVAAGNPVTAEVGVTILEQGGSAGDAVAAMVVASCVAETVFTGLGGGGFATYFDATTSTVSCLDFFVAVPGLAGRRSAQVQHIPIDFGGVVVPYAVGPATVAVPGLPAGVEALHQRWGRLSWPDVLAPSIRHAEHGVTLAPMHAKVLSTIAPAMLIGGGTSVYGRDGAALPSGSHLFHPGLDRSLRMLRDEGAQAFYSGPIAEQMVRAVGEKGDLSAPDLAAYEVLDTIPRHVTIGDVDVMARGDDLDDLLTTLARLELCSDDAELATRLVSLLRAEPRRGDTTSLAVCDDEGNACAATTSMGLSSGVWLPDYGIHLNSMLGEGELLRHRLQPGERMSSMMSPLVVLAADAPVLVAGAAGGSRIRSALTQVLVNVVHHQMSVQDAVDAPRLHPVPGRVHVEPGMRDSVLDALRKTDEVVTWPALDSYFGGVAAIGLSGPGADPRRGGDVRRLGAPVS